MASPRKAASGMCLNSFQRLLFKLIDRERKQSRPAGHPATRGDGGQRTDEDAATVACRSLKTEGGGGGKTHNCSRLLPSTPPCQPFPQQSVGHRVKRAAGLDEASGLVQEGSSHVLQALIMKRPSKYVTVADARRGPLPLWLCFRHCPRVGNGTMDWMNPRGLIQQDNV